MNRKIEELRKRVWTWKQNDKKSGGQQSFHFSPFSRKQKKVLTWWCQNSPVNEKDGIIADGAIVPENGQHVVVFCYVGNESF